MAVPTIRPGFGGTLMPRSLSDFIFETALRNSAMMQLATETPLPTTGKAIPVVTGKPAAGWVSEAGRKPVSDATIGTKTMDPKKLAVIVPFSAEYLRDVSINIFDMIRPLIAEAFAKAFDSATIKGTSTPFSNYIYQTTNSQEIGTNAASAGGVWKDFVDALGKVTDEAKSYRVTGWVFDEIAEGLLLGAVDSQGRPLLVDSPANSSDAGRIVGRPIFYTDQAAQASGLIKGFGGDFSQAVFGVSEEITYDITDQASIVLADGTTTLHLWQENLVGLRAEAEFGFLANDVQAFVKLADAT